MAGTGKVNPSSKLSQDSTEVTLTAKSKNQAVVKPTPVISTTTGDPIDALNVTTNNNSITSITSNKQHVKVKEKKRQLADTTQLNLSGEPITVHFEDTTNPGNITCTVVFLGRNYRGTFNGITKNDLKNVPGTEARLIGILTSGLQDVATIFIKSKTTQEREQIRLKEFGAAGVKVERSGKEEIVQLPSSPERLAKLSKDHQYVATAVKVDNVFHDALLAEAERHATPEFQHELQQTRSGLSRSSSSRKSLKAQSKQQQPQISSEQAHQAINEGIQLITNKQIQLHQIPQLLGKLKPYIRSLPTDEQAGGCMAIFKAFDSFPEAVREQVVHFLWRCIPDKHQKEAFFDNTPDQYAQSLNLRGDEAHLVELMKELIQKDMAEEQAQEVQQTSNPQEQDLKAFRKHHAEAIQGIQTALQQANSWDEVYPQLQQFAQSIQYFDPNNQKQLSESIYEQVVSKTDSPHIHNELAWFLSSCIDDGNLRNTFRSERVQILSETINNDDAPMVNALYQLFSNNTVEKVRSAMVGINRADTPGMILQNLAKFKLNVETLPKEQQVPCAQAMYEACYDKKLGDQVQNEVAGFLIGCISDVSSMRQFSGWIGAEREERGLQGTQEQDPNPDLTLGIQQLSAGAGIAQQEIVLTKEQQQAYKRIYKELIPGLAAALTSESATAGKKKEKQQQGNTENFKEILKSFKQDIRTLPPETQLQCAKTFYGKVILLTDETTLTAENIPITDRQGFLREVEDFLMISVSEDTREALDKWIQTVNPEQIEQQAGVSTAKKKKKSHKPQPSQQQLQFTKVLRDVAH